MAFVSPEQGKVEMRFDSTGALFGRSNSVAEIEVSPAGSSAGIGFDTLGNVLVVDPTFTEATSGWGVRAFAYVSAAVTASTANDLIYCNGILAEEVALITITHDLTFTGNAILDPTQSNFDVDGCNVTIYGNLEFQAPTSSFIVQNGGTLTMFGGKAVGANVHDDGSKFIIHNTEITGLISGDDGLGTLGNVVARNCTIDTLSSFASTTADVRRCDIITQLNNVTLDPLDGTNTLVNIPYREVVTLASLPAASAANAGATAATSDGGSGSIPALMYSNGSAWVVAAE